MKKNLSKIIIASFLVIFGIIFRFILKETVAIPNFEPITAISLLVGSFLGGIYSLIIPLLITFFSDLYLGNTIVYLFTWSAFAFIGLFGNLFKDSEKHYYLKITGGGIISVIFFFLWTNFGWWLTSGMYAKTIGGLAQCYIAGLPFLKNQLYSAILFVPAFGFVFSWFKKSVFIESSLRLKKFKEYLSIK